MHLFSIIILTQQSFNHPIHRPLPLPLILACHSSIPFLRRLLALILHLLGFFGSLIRLFLSDSLLFLRRFLLLLLLLGLLQSLLLLELGEDFGLPGGGVGLDLADCFEFGDIVICNLDPPRLEVL